MDSFGKRQPVKRIEDLRFLTGQGRYVDDIAPEGALYAVFLRSPVAHGEIKALDLEAARAMPGVHLVLCAQDLEAAGVKLGMGASLVKNRDGSKGAAPLRPLLARDRVRYVGEAVAVVIADTADQGRDAVEAIELDIEDLPAHVALSEGGPQIHPEAPGNLAYDWGKGDPDAVEAVLQDAAHVVTLPVGDNRIIVNSLEPRGCFAEMTDGRLHLCFGGQGVWGMKSALIRNLGLSEDAVRVTNPDVGGGFGMKGFTYPEYYVVAQAARMLNRAVRWMADRSEAMLSDNGGRDLHSTVTLGFDADHKITAYKVETLCNLGPITRSMASTSNPSCSRAF